MTIWGAVKLVRTGLKIKKFMERQTRKSRTRRIRDLEEAVRTAIVVMKNRDSYPGHELAARIKLLEKVLKEPYRHKEEERR